MIDLNSLLIVVVVLSTAGVIIEEDSHSIVARGSVERQIHVYTNIVILAAIDGVHL